MHRGGWPPATGRRRDEDGKRRNTTAEDQVQPDAEAPALPAEDRWVMLIDPARQRQGGDLLDPPLQAVVGGWFVAADGATGCFDANPEYVPSSPDSPTDPIDATLRLVDEGGADTAALLATLPGAVFGVAVDQDQNPVVAPPRTGRPRCWSPPHRCTATGCRCRAGRRSPPRTWRRCCRRKASTC